MEKRYYGIIPAEIRYDNDLCANAKLLYSEIWALSQEKGFCFASNKYFADLYDVHKITISRWISQLERKGHIKTEIIPGYARRIYVNANSINQKANTVSENVNSISNNVKGDKQNNLLPLTKELIPLNKNANHNIINNNKPNIKKNKKVFNQKKAFEEVYKLYPRKEGKKQAFKHFKTTVQDETDLYNIKLALDNYCKHLKRKKTDPQFFKMASTWFNNWHDWLNWKEPSLDNLIVNPSQEEIEQEKRKKQEEELYKQKVLASKGSTTHKQALKELCGKILKNKQIHTEEEHDRK